MAQTFQTENPDRRTGFVDAAPGSSPAPATACGQIACDVILPFMSCDLLVSILTLSIMTLRQAVNLQPVDDILTHSPHPALGRLRLLNAQMCHIVCANQSLQRPSPPSHWLTSSPHMLATCFSLRNVSEICNYRSSSEL